MKYHPVLRIVFVSIFILSSIDGLVAQQFQTPVTQEMLDNDRFAEWYDGAEHVVIRKKGLETVLTTQKTCPEYSGVEFGDSKNWGLRHLRLAFKETVPVGTLLIRGVGVPSILKDSVPNDADIDLTKEELWLPGQRIVGEKTTMSEDGLDRLSYSVWIFPPNTKTRAIRFSHNANVADKSYAGWLGGLYVLQTRLVNLASFGHLNASSQPQNIARVADGQNNSWQAWDNGTDGAKEPVSTQKPESISVVWDKPITLCGLATLWTGFSSAEIDVYVGPSDTHPNESINPAHWKTVASRSDLLNGYVPPLLPNWFDFDKTVTTRAVRLRITGVTTEDHDHLKNNTKDGKRVWLGELLCLVPLQDQEEAVAVLPQKPQADHPPIPVRFSLEEDAVVTLVVEKEDGTRVRNLVADTLFPKGENVVYWDGCDDLLRDNESARHGVYNIPKRLVEPDKYRVRGLYRKPLELHYEFAVYNEGTPPWTTADNTGGWLTNHTPPSCALWVSAGQSPLVYLGSYVSEGGHGLAWFDVTEKNGELITTKKGGVGWIGGAWTGAQYLARDTGEKRNKNHCLYVASIWGTGTNNRDNNQDAEVRISAIPAQGEPMVVKYRFTPLNVSHNEHDWGPNLGGFAVYDGIAAMSLSKLNKLAFLDVQTGNLREMIDWTNPQGLGYDADGTLFLISDNQLFRFPKGEKPKTSDQTKPPFLSELDAPKSLTFDTESNIYVSEQGASHHVRVFDKTGKPLRTIGKTGTPSAGAYNPQRMNHPAGLAIDGEQRLWVTESDFQPKRVSVWTKDGKLIRAFYGPAEYGGGGKLDPIDPTQFFYHGMEFRLDWNKGTFQLVRVYFRKDDGIESPDGHDAGKLPETPLYPQGKTGPRYFTNCFNNSPTSGSPLTGIWYDDPKTGVARLVSVFGSAHDWSIFKRDEFQSRLPEGIDLKKDRWQNLCRVLWCDLNGDGKVQPEETQFEAGDSGGITVGVSDGQLHFIASRITDASQYTDETAVSSVSSVLYRAVSKKGSVPVFDLSKKQILVSGTQRPRSSGGDQVLFDPATNQTAVTLGINPFAPESVSGTKNGVPVWSYPNPWPGLHASHESPAPQQAGQLIGVTRMLGDWITGGDGQSIFAVNGNQGNIYLMTLDGLYVAELFHDIRLAPTWSMPVGKRNMEVGGLSLHDENFWPSITQTQDGNVFLVDGANTALVRIDGLKTIRAIKPFALELTKTDLETASHWLIESEQHRQNAAKLPPLRVPLRQEEVKVDGELDDWSGAGWAVIDRSGVGAWFDSNSKPYDITASVCVSKNRLVAVFRTNIKDLLRNSGELPQALFKTGGCLDVMIGSNATADSARRDPVEGDLRLLVTQVQGKPKAVLYRAVVPNTKEPVPFSSPWRTLTLDSVDDVTEQLEFAAGENGVYEIAIPLKVLGLQPKTGMTIKGDIGILRGNGFETLARVYWSNKSTAITADVPSEAQLTPNLWGNWLFQ